MASMAQRVIAVCRRYDGVNFWSGFLTGVTVGVLLLALFLKLMA